MFLRAEFGGRFLHPGLSIYPGFLLLIVWTTLFPLWAESGTVVKHFPQVVLNAGSTTSFTIHNPSSIDSIMIEIEIYSPEGEELVNRQIELGPEVTETFTFGDSQEALTRGWAKLSSEEEFMASQFFRLFVGGLKPRVGVLPSPTSEEIRFFGFINEEFKSGFALHNPSSTEATEVTIRAREDNSAELVIEKTVTLAPLHSVALFLDDPRLSPSAPTTFEGVVEITVNSPPVAVLSLIQEKSGDVATVPVEATDYLYAGESNTSVGRSALGANTTGTWNTAFGVSALGRNTEGSYNTAHCGESLGKNTTGSRNTALGYRALSVNTAAGNTAVGADALRDNDNGGGNTATGIQALAFNRDGHSNAANGTSSLGLNTGGSNNTAMGLRSLYNNSMGNMNVALGVRALYTNTTGTENVALGAYADVAEADLHNAIAIGWNAVVDASNKIRFGSDSVSVIEAPVGLTIVSDRDRKESFRVPDGEEILTKLSELPVSTWNFIGQDPAKFRHYGPMAQDFFAAFGKDEIGTIGTATTINTNDLAGVLMIAVQALERRTSELRHLAEEIEILKSRLDGLKSGESGEAYRSAGSRSRSVPAEAP